MKRLLVVLAACGDSSPCADIPGTCANVTIEAPDIAEVDAIELDVLYRTVHGTSETALADGATVALPVVVGIELGNAGQVELELGVVAAGKLAGTVLGTGATTTRLLPGDSVDVLITLAPPAICDVDTLYCGGTLVAGDADTVYGCNPGGVPVARGKCLAGCAPGIATTNAECNAAGGPCSMGDYCGGDEVPGDPLTLYRCTDGAPTNPRVCTNRCVVNENNDDDFCQ
ncbi:MAG: hypothetical protein ABI867_30770 [Kofleriaceae bacterium]